MGKNSSPEEGLVLAGKTPSSRPQRLRKHLTQEARECACQSRPRGPICTPKTRSGAGASSVLAECESVCSKNTSGESEGWLGAGFLLGGRSFPVCSRLVALCSPGDNLLGIKFY